MSEQQRRPPAEDEWGVGWEAHRREQLVRGLAATPAERLAWLETMIEIAFRVGALPRPRSGPWDRNRE